MRRTAHHITQPPARRRRFPAAIAIAATAVLLSITACGDSQKSQPAGEGRGSPPGDAGTRLPRDGAPPVPEPIEDTARWQDSPCELLSGQQLARLGFDPYRTTPTGNDGGAGCTYSELGVIEVRTTIFTDIPGGLTRLYAERSEFKLFEPIDPLKSHPAVIADLADQRKKGRCVIFVGLTDELAYRTIAEADPKSRPGKNPCKFAADLTVLALHAMKAGTP
jgi:hypothetical protein